MYNFDNRTMFITGGSTGIGFKTAEKFLKCGGNVSFVSRNIDTGEHSLTALRNISDNVEYIYCDVSRENEVKLAIEKTLEHFGNIDFAFNNAGVEGVFKPLNELSFEEYMHVLNINLNGVFLSMKYELDVMLENSKGVIINTSSVSGMMNFPSGIPYVVSKHGVESLTKCAAMEFASQGIRINCIAPGEIHTPMSDRTLQTEDKKERMKSIIPMKYIAEPDVIADGVLWLLSESASYITGATIPIDGGFTARI